MRFPWYATIVLRKSVKGGLDFGPIEGVLELASPCCTCPSVEGNKAEVSCLSDAYSGFWSFGKRRSCDSHTARNVEPTR